MKPTLWIAVIVVSLILVGLAVSASAGPTAHRRILLHYEIIRQALLEDTIEGIAVHATDIRDACEDFDSLKNAIKPGKEADGKTVLADIREASAKLMRAKSLVDAREEFGQLSEYLIRYRQLSISNYSIAVYCSMVKKSWLQPAGDIGNPYLGASMATCGEIVPD